MRTEQKMFDVKLKKLWRKTKMLYKHIKVDTIHMHKFLLMRFYHRRWERERENIDVISFFQSLFFNPPTWHSARVFRLCNHRLWDEWLVWPYQLSFRYHLRPPPPNTSIFSLSELALKVTTLKVTTLSMYLYVLWMLQCCPIEFNISTSSNVVFCCGPK